MQGASRERTGKVAGTRESRQVWVKTRMGCSATTGTLSERAGEETESPTLTNILVQRAAGGRVFVFVLDNETVPNVVYLDGHHTICTSVKTQNHRAGEEGL